jgi:Glycosyltransferase family 87
MDVIQEVPLSAADRWRLAARRALTHSLIVWPPLTIGWMLLVASRKGVLAFDFQQAYVPAAHAVLAGHSPYPEATVAAFFPRTAFIYPPLTAYLAAPFLVVPLTVAESLVTALTAAFLIATLRLLDVRDWRCYLIAFVWVPTYSAIQTGNLTLLLGLLFALLWRYRDRPAVAGPIAGAAVALKLFAWPLLVWLFVTRRRRAAWGAALATVALAVVPWAGIAFAGMTGYPHLLSVLTRAERGDAYSVPALLAGTVGWGAADLIGIAIGLIVLSGSVLIGRRDERRSFTLAIASMLLLTPIVQMHYFALLVVVLALYRPRFDWAWALPLLLWVGPQTGAHAGWQVAAVLAVAAGVVLFATRRPRTPMHPPLRPSAVMGDTGSS